MELKQKWSRMTSRTRAFFLYFSRVKPLPEDSFLSKALAVLIFIWKCCPFFTWNGKMYLFFKYSSFIITISIVELLFYGTLFAWFQSAVDSIQTLTELLGKYNMFRSRCSFLWGDILQLDLFELMLNTLPGLNGLFTTRCWQYKSFNWCSLSLSLPPSLSFPLFHPLATILCHTMGQLST